MAAGLASSNVLPSSKLSRFPARIQTLRDDKVRLYYEEFGEAKIDCAILLKKTQWGHLASQCQSTARDPAGVLYMRLHIADTQDYQLHFLQVRTEFTSTAGSCGPSVDSIAPKVPMTGEPHEVATTTSIEINPEIEVAGVSGKLANYRTSREGKEISRWKFSAMAGGVDDIDSNVAWRWEGPKQANGGSFSRQIYAAVVVKHHQEPFLVNTTSEAKLTGFRHVWRKLKFRPSRGSSKQVIPGSNVIELSTMDLENTIMEMNRWQAARVFPDTVSAP